VTAFDRVKKKLTALQSPNMWPSLISIQKEENQPRAKFKPSLTARDVMASDLCASRTLMRTAKREVRSTYMWMNNLMVYIGLPHRGNVYLIVNENADIRWFQTVQKQCIPPEGLKFALNAIQGIWQCNAVWRRN